MNDYKIVQHNSAGGTDERVLDRRPSRVWAMIQNKDAAEMAEVFLGAENLIAAEGIQLMPAGDPSATIFPGRHDLIIDTDHPWGGEVFVTCVAPVHVVEVYVE